jgi:hypothetical protein
VSFIVIKLIPGFVKFSQLIWKIKLRREGGGVGPTNTHTHVQTLKRHLEHIILCLGRKLN